MKEVISRLQIIVDNDKLRYNAYFEGCLKSTSCKQVINASPSEIFNTIYYHKYDAISTTAMTNEKWEIALKEVDDIYKISQGPLNSTEYFLLVEDFYHIYSEKEINRLTEKKKRKLD